jgi:hypothetical protein
MAAPGLGPPFFGKTALFKICRIKKYITNTITQGSLWFNDGLGLKIERFKLKIFLLF